MTPERTKGIDEQSLVCVGVVGIIDPAPEEVAGAVADSRRAGVRVVIRAACGGPLVRFLAQLITAG